MPPTAARQCCVEVRGHDNEALFPVRGKEASLGRSLSKTVHYAVPLDKGQLQSLLRYVASLMQPLYRSEWQTASLESYLVYRIRRGEGKD
jgi:hypothetical protein